MKAWLRLLLCALLASCATAPERLPQADRFFNDARFGPPSERIHAEDVFALSPDMKRYLESHGFQADGFEAPLDKLESAAIPAIVLIKENGYNHFVVVKGVRDGRVLIGDPSGGTRALTRNAFHAVWDNDILFVVTNRQEQARFNLSSDWLVAPRAPIGAVVDRTGSSGVAIPKFGPGDF